MIIVNTIIIGLMIFLAYKAIEAAHKSYLKAKNGKK